MKKLLLLFSLTFGLFANAQNKMLNIYTSVTGSMQIFELYLKQADGTYTLLKSKEEDSGHWLFDSLEAATYRVHVSMAYAKYLPTWYPNAILWDEASDIVISTADTTVIQIGMVANPAHTGPGSIEGELTEGMLKTQGEPLKNVRVVIKDSSNAFIAMSSSNDSGRFLVNNLPLGLYKIIVDVVNASTANPKTVTLDSNNMNSTVKLTVNKAGTFNTGLKPAPVMQDVISLYPNPSADKVFVNADKEGTIYLYDICGKLVLQESISSTKAVSLQHLPQGIYTARISTGNKTLTQKIVKQ